MKSSIRNNSSKYIPIKTDLTNFPRISIVTPNFNQGDYIEETIQSILDQNYPNLEYIIIDGGSTDNSVEILKKYEKHLSWWVSEPDLGQSDAINKGFEKATGLYGTWINSDDLLEKDALNQLVKYIDPAKYKNVILGSYIEFNSQNRATIKKSSDITDLGQLVDIKNGWRRGFGNQIGQMATFFPIELFRQVGMLNLQNHYTMDYELWGRFLNAGAHFIHIPETLGRFRIHEAQKTTNRNATTLSLIRTAKFLIKESPFWSENEKKIHFAKLRQYQIQFYYGKFRSWMGIKRRSKILLSRLSRKLRKK